jgi:hypothetical protein
MDIKEKKNTDRGEGMLLTNSGSEQESAARSCYRPNRTAVPTKCAEP